MINLKFWADNTCFFLYMLKTLKVISNWFNQIMNSILQKNFAVLYALITTETSHHIKQFILTSCQSHFIHFYNILNKRSFEDSLWWVSDLISSWSEVFQGVWMTWMVKNLGQLIVYLLSSKCVVGNSEQLHYLVEFECIVATK